jgi:hypothetical protein
MTTKELREVFKELDFHHSHGYYISNQNHNHRLFYQGGFIYPTTNNVYLHDDCVRWKEKEPEDVKLRLFLFFQMKSPIIKNYTKEDLQQAFEDGKLYGDNELELPNDGTYETAFDIWFNTKFNIQ